VRRPGLFLIGLITFVFNLGGGVIAPAVPLYARSLGGDYQDLGLIGASHGLAFALLTIPLGRASDRFGRRALLLLSALAVGGAAALYAVSTHIVGLAVAKVLEAAGWAAFWPAYGAYAASFVVGTSAAGFIIEAAGLRMPFLVYLGTAVLALGLSLAVPGGREPGRHGHAVTTTVTRLPGGEPRHARGQRVLAYGTGVVYVFGLGTVLAFLPAYAADRGLSPRGVGLLLGGYWTARVAGSLAAGRVSDALGRRAVLVPAMVIAGVAGLLTAAPAAVALLVLGTLGLGLTAGASAPTCVGLIADHVAPASRGMAMGLFEASCGGSILTAGLVGGAAAQQIGAASPYVVVAGLALAWSLVLARRLSSRAPAGG